MQRHYALSSCTRSHNIFKITLKIWAYSIFLLICAKPHYSELYLVLLVPMFVERPLHCCLQLLLAKNEESFHCPLKWPDLCSVVPTPLLCLSLHCLTLFFLLRAVSLWVHCTHFKPELTSLWIKSVFLSGYM